MRYFVITYVRKPDGKMDEQVTLEKSLKPRHYQMANVILDFKTQTVLQCSLAGTQVPKEWQRIRDFYYQHYSKIIDGIESKLSIINNLKKINETKQNNPD
jgi:hypothetical protein